VKVQVLTEAHEELGEPVAEAAAAE
jgi:hypothetical protein